MTTLLVCGLLALVLAATALFRLLRGRPPAPADPDGLYPWEEPEAAGVREEGAGQRD